MKKIALWLVCGLLIVGTAGAQTRKSESVVTIAGESYYVHTVRPGDTFYSLGKTYETDEETIRRNNPHTDDGLKTDQVIKIPVRRNEAKPLSERKKRKLFDVHTVNQGETAYSISKRYGVGLDVLMEDNEGFDPARLSIGQRINIRKASLGTSDAEEIEEQIESYKDALNSVSDRFTHHVVERGETLYSLGKRFGVPVDTIERYNDAILRDGLRSGSIVRIPLPDTLVRREPFPVDTLAESLLAVSPGERLAVKAIDVTKPVRVALLLPMKTGERPNRQFMEFYQGVLLALEELKATGVSVRVDLFDVGRSAQAMEEVLRNPELGEADLILGPVYDECYAPAAAFAARHGIPVVSPLAPVESADNNLLFQVAPDPASKTGKLGAELAPERNVIVFSGASEDAEFAAEIRPLLPPSAHRLSYAKGMGNAVLENLLSGDRENVIVVLTSDETTTDAILAYVASVQNSLIARSVKNPSIRVIGSPRWARFRNIDRKLFFKLNLRYVASYHADRWNERVAGFDRRYIAEFGALPSLYAYRGYDVAKLFVGAVHLHGSQFADHLNGGALPLLQTPYRFEQKHPGGKYENVEWPLVRYGSDFTIGVE